MASTPSSQQARRVLQRALAATAVVVMSAAQAAPNGWVLNTNQTINLVDLASNAEAAAGGTSFPSDSLAVSPGGTLFSADSAGNLWDVTGPPIPVGPTLRTQIADLDWAGNGLWGYSNASTELFFYDLGASSVTYAATLTLPGSLPAGAIVTGVAHQPGSGDIFLSAHDGLNNDLLLRVPAASSVAQMVGGLAHGDSFSYISDIDFDATGTLHAMTWFYRWFYSVSPTSAATSFISAGPHRDATALALTPVPETASAWLFGLGLAVLGARVWQRRRDGGFASFVATGACPAATGPA